MQSRNPAVRKSREPNRRPCGLLSVRAALVLGFAVLAALGGAGLLYVAHRPVALIVLGAVSVFAAAVKLLDGVIELGPLGSPSTTGRRCVCHDRVDVARPSTAAAIGYGSEGREHAGGSVGVLPRTRRRSIHDSRNLSRAPAASLRDPRPRS